MCTNPNKFIQANAHDGKTTSRIRANPVQIYLKAMTFEHRSHARCLFFCCVSLVFSIQTHARALEQPDPGQYHIAVTLELPHLSSKATTKSLSLCVTPQDFANGKAFRIRTETPLAKCAYSARDHHGQRITFKVACPGKRSAYATAEFDVKRDSFDGVIKMNMGGKNMTLTERQVGRRVGDCKIQK